MMNVAYDCFSKSQELPTYDDKALRKLSKIFDLFSINREFFDINSEVFGTVIIRLKALGYNCVTDSFCPLLSEMSRDHLFAYNIGFSKSFDEYLEFLTSMKNSTSESPITNKLIALALFDKMYFSSLSNLNFRKLKDVLNRLEIILPDLSGYISNVQLRKLQDL